MARKKSINDIMAQLGRIGQAGNARTNNNFYQTRLGKKVRNTANRYISNIENAPGMTQTRNGVPFVDNTTKVSRTVYMGMSAG